MRRLALLIAAGVLTMVVTSPAIAGVATPHLISFQGQALDNAGKPLTSGNLSVRIYDSPSAGTEIFNSGAEFNGAIHDGVFSVCLGSGVPLLLDNTRMYYLEVDINGQEVAGDAAGGRKPFYPGGGSHERADLEMRIQALEHVADFTCADGWLDLNGYPWDTCEFQIDEAGVYVAPPEDGGVDDGSCGDPLHPCATISNGILRAHNLSKVRVHVMNGLYHETVVLWSGISLFGGYDTYWHRDVTVTNTIIEGSEPGTHKKTLIAEVGLPTEVSGFIIRGVNSTEYGGNSYAVWTSGGSALTLRDNRIYAGSGGPGQPGESGTDGADGVAGNNGTDAHDTGDNPCMVGWSGGAGGVIDCWGINASGGNGGSAVCPPVYNTQSQSGAAGHSGDGAGGTPGAGGWDARYQGAICYPPVSGELNGTNGGNGVNGPDGGGGGGASNPYGTVSGFDWVGYAGSWGLAGGAGEGGGGGGAGGDAEAILPSEHDLLGATGGGGGSGGCGGIGGAPGTAGGGSFGIFLLQAGSVIENNFIAIGTGGRGGDGGVGGSAGRGGAGGVGGGPDGVSPIYCIGTGGKGGEGADGGDGGGGGGGCGGVAYGIYVRNGVGTPNYSLTNTFVGGTGGPGGSGGRSLGSSGTDGATGWSGNTNQY